MIIDVTNMYNYQIICNEQNIVGMIHSYSPSILSKTFINVPIKLNKKSTTSTIIKAQLVGE